MCREQPEGIITAATIGHDPSLTFHRLILFDGANPQAMLPEVEHQVLVVGKCFVPLHPSGFLITVLSK